VVLDKNITLTFSGSTTLSGSLELRSGALNAPAGSLNLGGSFRRSGGTFNHNNGMLVFNGATTQNLSLSLATAFYDLSVGAGTILVETDSGDFANVIHQLTNLGTIRKNLAIAGTGAYDFGLASGSLQVNTPGSLSSLQVDHIDTDHPNASGVHLQTGHYWVLTANSGASGFSASLTLPVSFTPATDGSDKLCRYTGAAGDPHPFDCGTAGENSGNPAAMTITRSNVTAFSSWTAGDNSSPTAVTVEEFGAGRSVMPYLLFALGLLAACVVAVTKKLRMAN
jgi:hypothetical protein